MFNKLILIVLPIKTTDLTHYQFLFDIGSTFGDLQMHGNGINAVNIWQTGRNYHE